MRSESSVTKELLEIAMNVIATRGLVAAHEWLDRRTGGNTEQRRYIIKRALRKLANEIGG